jgi:hypothetical protein
MAAGQGFKDFTTGEVLTANDVDGYLMQGIWVFADAAARDAAVTSPQEGNFAFLKDTNVTTYYTGSVWANLDTTGMVNPMTTTGDTIYSSSGSTPARLGIGTAGQVLQVNSGATAPEWATASSGGMTPIGTPTTLSGSTTVSITGIPGTYTDLVVDFYAVTTASNTDYNINPNGNASATDVIRGGTSLQQLNDGQLRILNNIAGPLSSSTNNSCRLIIANYAATTDGGKPFDLYGGFIGSDSSAQVNHVRGRIKINTAINQLDFVAGANWTAGEVKIYGVK